MGYVRALLVVFVTFTLAFAASALAFSARVKSVRDGDSVTVAANDGALTHVRLYGIDAPDGSGKIPVPLEFWDADVTSYTDFEGKRHEVE